MRILQPENYRLSISEENPVIRKICLWFLCTLIFFAGCAKRSLVSFENVEETNSVVITQVSGKKFEGTIMKTEPL